MGITESILINNTVKKKSIQSIIKNEIRIIDFIEQNINDDENHNIYFLNKKYRKNFYFFTKGDTLLILLTKYNKTLSTEYLIKYYSNLIDLNFVDKKGFTALYYSVKNNNIAISKLLINHGAEVDRKYRNSDGDEYHIFQFENIEIIKLFVEKYTSLNFLSLKKRTVLVHLAYLNCRDKKLLEVVISKTSDINKVDIYGFDAMYYSIINENKIFIELLLFSSDIFIVPKYKIFKDEEYPTIFLLLESPKISYLVKAFIEHSPEILYTKDMHDNNILHFLAKIPINQINIDIIEYILEKLSRRLFHGYNMFSYNLYDTTPYQLANNDFVNIVSHYDTLFPNVNFAIPFE
jgi:ankyrin repeat protein